MIWSWMKRCKADIKAANELGFVAHARALRWTRESDSFPLADVLKGAGYPHTFEAEPDLSTVKQTLLLLTNLKATRTPFKRWTVFLYGKGKNTRVVFAFTDPQDAVRARLTL